MRRAVEARLQLEGGEDLLDGSLCPEEIALGDAPETPALLGQRLLGRQVHMGDLEQRHALVAGVHVVACGSHEPEEKSRTQHALQLRQRLGQDEGQGIRILRLQRVRVRLEETAADEHVRDGPAEALLVRQPPEHLPARRQRRRHVFEPEARDLLDDVDLAPDIARAPVRDAN